jgi:hypothetical protein
MKNSPQKRCGLLNRHTTTWRDFDERNMLSRRHIIGTVAKAMAASPWFCAMAAYATDKMTRTQAEYQDAPNGIYSCGLCSLFEAPNGCKVVEGEVSKDGWCKAFALQD